MSLQRVPLNNFRGGLNTRDSPFELQQNESPDLLNVTISSLVGQLEARKGITRVDTGGLPAQTIDNMKQVVIGNNKRFLMLSIFGQVWAMEPSGAVKKLFSGSPFTIWDFEVYADAAFKDWVYMGNGADAMQKWDGEAGATVEWKATTGALPKGGTVCVWENRMFITNVTAQPQRIYFSEFSDPEATIKEYGFVDVRGPEEDLDAVQDLAVLGSRLFVLKRRSVYYISSAVTMLNRRIGSPGVWGRFQVTELEDKLYFFNPQGIFSTAGVAVTMETGSINNYFPEHLTAANADKARIAATKDSYPRLLLTLPTDGAKTCSKVIEMVPHINFRRIGGRRYLLLPAFMLHSIETPCITPWNPTGAEEMLVCGRYNLFGTESTSMPTISIVEPLGAPEESPLARGWTLPSWVSGLGGVLGKIARHAAFGGKPDSYDWEEPIGTTTGGRFGTVYKTPACSIEVVRPDKNANEPTITLGLAYPAAEQSGYSAKMKYEEGSKRWKLTIQKFEAGLGTTIATFFLADTILDSKIEAKLFPILGFNLTGTKLRVWLDKQEGAGWQLIGSATDSKYSEGRPVVEYTGKNWRLRNFSAGEGVFTVGARVSRLFYGATDEGEPYESRWQSSWLAIQGEEPKERLRRLNVELSGDVEVDVFVDFEETPRFTKKLPSAESGSTSQYRFARLRPETRGRFHSVRFRSPTTGTPFLINAAELVVRGGKEH